MRSAGVMRLSKPYLAWNADGSASATTAAGESWITHAEACTGRQRGRCSFSGCNEQAEVGGHVFITKRGVWIAPICWRCNHPKNTMRWQGSGSTLRAGILVTKAERTEDMDNAPRRTLRTCEECDEDISHKPAHHELCARCYSKQSSHHHTYARECTACGIDISHKPKHHTICLRCYRFQHDTATLTRQCKKCSEDISDRPEHHDVCLICYRRKPKVW
mmetsp:Transcript_830/g.2241  ORF Transcript_830/g.2241 Transcript_830/m.2241 type:complete len:218 (-) Transcript_830:328-981(-)